MTIKKSDAPSVASADSAGTPATTGKPAEVKKPATQAKAFDPFDPESIRLAEQDRVTLGVDAVCVEMQARRPKRQEWVRTHPTKVADTCLFKLEEADEFYLVVPDMRPHSDLFEMTAPYRIQLATNRAGSPFLWIARYPADDGGAGSSWHRSGLNCQRLAETQWIRVTADRGAGAYVPHTTTAKSPDPKWPGNSMRDLLELCFRARVIDSPDHLILKMLRGEE